MATRLLFVFVFAIFASTLGACSSTPSPLSPEESKHLEIQVLGARHDFETTEPGTKTYFNTAYAYAVFPRVTSGAVLIGGAHGHGLVYEGGKEVGMADLTLVNVGASLGGRRFAEVIFFQNQSSLAAFKSNTLEFDARAAAVAASHGDGTAADYVNGVRVFSIQDGGLMVEAAIGGQKFRYQPYAQ